MRRRVLLVASLVALLGAVACAGARADGIGITSMSSVETSTQAGAHPDIVVKVDLETQRDLPPTECKCQILKDLKVNTPAGLIGSPRGLTQCAEADYAVGACPSDSQVGLVLVFLPEFFGIRAYQPLYNMEPREDELALLATYVPLSGLPIYTTISSRTESDYGLEFNTYGIPDLTAIGSLTQITWGVPTSHSHDAVRWPYGAGLNSYVCGESFDPLPNIVKGEPVCGLGTSGAPPFLPVAAIGDELPFLSNPTSCSGPLTVTAETTAYDLGARHGSASFPATTGCDQLSFDPSLSGAPTTEDADAPSGVNVSLTVPQPLVPTLSSPSAIRATRVTLPPGFTINSSAADGKTACTAAEANFGTRAQAHCPEFAKIGTLSIESTALPGTVGGAIYLGEPLPGDRYRVFLTADGFSLHIKLAGSAKLDPRTGQVQVSFDDLPQAPFEEFDLHFFGGERGLLATPIRCGTYPIESEFLPWAASLPTQTSTQFFTVRSGPGGADCPSTPRGFSPTVNAGVSDSTAGAHSTFSFELNRADGTQNLASIQVATPPGFSAKLAGIPYCPDATLAALAQLSYAGLMEQATPACAASQVGVAGTSAGAGSRPASLSGRVYLAGPYNGAPLSLAVVTPAVSGPYDLGNVVIRVALRVDPTDAHVTAISDPLPQIVDGIPLRLRRVLVVLDRAGFALNPTNCSPQSVVADVAGDEGGTVQRTSHFQVSNCADLPYGPRLQLKLRGGVNRRGHPAIRAIFRAKPGEANTRDVTVTLPPGELLDNSHIGAICTRVNFARQACPASSLIGHAEVRTPLLDSPLSGSVYLRTSSQDLPDIAVDLRGQVDFVLLLHVDSVNGRLRTKLQNGPDIPVSQFVLDLAGGRKGLLQNSEGLCDRARSATARMVGQNGATLNAKVSLQPACGAARHKRQQRGRR